MGQVEGEEDGEDSIFWTRFFSPHSIAVLHTATAYWKNSKRLASMSWIQVSFIGFSDRWSLTGG